MGRELAAGQLEILQHVRLSLPRRAAAGGSGSRGSRSHSQDLVQARLHAIFKA
jgi:hypothetical protein